MKEFKWSDLTEEETKQMVDKALKHISENSEHTTTWQEYLDEMELIAEEQGYKLTETAEKVAKFRARTHQPISICPCDPKNPYRGCVGSACKLEIERDGICKCQAYKKKG